MIAVDLFAGFGGLTAGAERAGVRVAWAANHWRLAVDVHGLNHPDTLHVCQDLRQADWTSLPDYSLLLAAPACQGHSEAAQPKRRRYHDALRATAWAVVDCAEVTAPQAIIIENVVPFQRWKLFPLYVEALELLGYHVQQHVLRASHYGVPQRRDRLFLVATRNRAVTLDLRPGPEPGFRPCIDSSAGRWRPVSAATPAIRGRIAKGRRNHGRTFLSQHVSNHPGVGLDEPIRTITTKDQWCLVEGDRYRSLTVRELARAQGFCDSYRIPAVSRADALRGIGNAVPPPLAEQLVTAVCDAL
jgi:DNA (cytosine-5)-methyltransferase 1